MSRLNEKVTECLGLTSVRAVRTRQSRSGELGFSRGKDDV
jgi:hypothetical protein